jgi:hypothetical protein
MAKTKRRLEWEAKNKKRIKEHEEFEQWFMSLTKEDCIKFDIEMRKGVYK